MNNELSAASIFSLLETNKQQRQSFIMSLMDELEAGNVDPLKVFYQSKCIEKILDELTNTDEKKNKDGFMIAKRFRQMVLDAAEKHNQKEFDFMNAKIKMTETGTKYDYSKTGDVELLEWQKQAEELKAKIDARQKLLQNVSEKGMIITNEETGETYTVYKPAKSSTSFLTLSLK